MVDMMLTLMDVMSRMMRGGRNYSYYPYSPIPGSGLPMSPAYPYSSGFGLSPWSTFNPFTANNPFVESANSIPSSIVENANKSEKNSFFGTNLDQVWESLEGNMPGFSAASMNGIWQAISGDVMAIYNDHYFIWTDGNRRHLAGSIMIKGKQLIAYIPANKRYLSFQIYREDDKFAVRDQNGQIYLFKKIH